MINLIAGPTGVGARGLRIVLPGGSGQVGQALARSLQERGHHVTVLTRGPYTAPNGRRFTGTASTRGSGRRRWKARTSASTWPGAA
jgi:nucleoside-diphosphate-sugar epimerase